MKKLNLVILAIVIISTLVVSSCASAPVPKYTPPTQAAPATGNRPPATTAAPAPATRPATAPASSAPAYHPPTTSAASSPNIVATVPPGPRPTGAPAYSPAPGYPTAPSTSSGQAPGGGTIGLATGGAKDIANFRENISHGYLPLPTDVTYEGLFYDYYFDTGAAGPANKLYSPSYSYAVTRDPISKQVEYYLSVGLNSGMKESDFQRKKLNLAVVLDNSGSMGEIYTQYYYDRSGNRVNPYDGEGIYRKTKMQSADESVVSILNRLNNNDRLALVTFNSSANLDKPMGPVASANMQGVKNHVLDIAAGGSTNLAAGIDVATRQYNNLSELNNYEYENRIIILTDAEPNTGDFTSGGLMNMLTNNANRRIYTTIIGIGVDFNSQLIDAISKVKGANYYSVHSPREFQSRVNDEFDYMVTPLVFNLQLNFQSDGWRIEKVFGSPEADSASGNLMKINTLFASKSEGGENKGGLVLLKLTKMSASGGNIYLKTSYEDRNGRIDGDRQTITVESTSPEYFANNGIRKGILLSRYAALMKNWMIDQRQHVQVRSTWNPCITDNSGIIIPVEFGSQWERQSLPLTVSDPYRRIFQNFSQYFLSEMNSIRDNTLGQEMDVLNLLSRF
jgi:Ca-activated chloride channel homolog